MAVRERGSFIQKEQFRPATRLHDGAVSSAKLQAAGDPPPHLPVADDVPLRVMNDAAIAHQRSSRRYGHDLPKRRHAILQWHRAPMRAQSKLSFNEPGAPAAV